MAMELIHYPEEYSMQIAQILEDGLNARAYSEEIKNNLEKQIREIRENYGY